MALKYPPAKRKWIQFNFFKFLRKTTRGVILHTTASRAASQYGWFNRLTTQASSNLHIDMNGNVEQYVDLNKGAWTSGAASSSTIGVETAGLGSDAWTPAQVQAIVRFLAWAHHVYKIPVRMMTSSLASEKGIGWHRLGIDGNFPPMPSLLAGRRQRGKGELWSKSSGKVCPGDKRIIQIPAIVKAVEKNLDRPLLKRQTTRAVWVRDFPGGKKTKKLPAGEKIRIRRGSRAKVGRTVYVKTKRRGWIPAKAVGLRKKV